MPDNTPPFLDVPTLLEVSRHRASTVRFWQLAGVFLLVVMISTYFSTWGERAAGIVNVISGLTMILLVTVLMLIMWTTVRRARREQMQLEAIDELIRLRRWQEAGSGLQELLGQPTRMPHVRVQALIFLSSVLVRYGRFDDAVTVQDFLLEHVQMDGGTSHGLRLGRAMALLRQDHLVDADRAISELRNQVSRAGRAREQAQAAETAEPESESPQAISAGLALVELYRDIKTNHPAEAIELFEQSYPALREQLGMRVADAHVMAAYAHDQLNRPAEAQSQFEKASLLAPVAELVRRYPETQPLVDKYQASVMPKEVAA